MLETRALLAREIRRVEEEVERLKRLAAYDQCLSDTNTHAITRKSSEVTRAVVTDSLAESFQEELMALGFTHVDVALEPTGGERGALYHQVVLTRAPATPLANVLSEGEARSLAIAAFFSELSTAADPSAILFDDPVSSLDHHWRENVALRLAVEAANRQVVVFTHDIVFLIALTEAAEESGVAIQHQFVRREHAGPGVASADLPWAAMRLKERIGVLRRLHQDASALFRSAPRAEYDAEAQRIYELLRKAWERGVEEVLIGGVVERYRKTIQTQQISRLAAITEQDCEELERGMTKCSRWLHDQAAAEQVAVPEPDELSTDIEALATWRSSINSRR